MRLTIPRGIIYHTLRQDIFALIQSCFLNLRKKEVIQQFEQNFATYIGCRYALAFPYARVAIYYALKLKQFPSGAEIIMPPITIKAILDVVLDLNLKPVFVDLDPDTLCFDLKKLQESITGNTRAILITYLYGMVPDVESMLILCKEKNLFVIEDFSQCLNGQYKGKKVGGFGDVGVYSASSIKTLDTYGGGLLVTDDLDLYSQLKICQAELSEPSRAQLIKKIYISIVRNLATTRIIFHLVVFPLLKLVSYFKPDTYIKNTGERVKSPISHLPKDWFQGYTSLQASVGLRLLNHVGRADNERIDNAVFLRSNSKAQFPQGVSNTANVFWQTIAYFSDPITTLGFLRQRQIDSATSSLEKISTLSKYPYQGYTPNADIIYECALFIPSYPRLKKIDLDHILKILDEISLSDQRRITWVE